MTTSTTTEESQTDTEAAETASKSKTPSWKVRAAALERFLNKNGRLPKSTGNPAEKSLSTWMIYQRMKFKEGSLDANHTGILMAIPGALETRTNSEDQDMIETAQEWCKANGFLPRPMPSTKKPWDEDQKLESRIANWMRSNLRTGIRKFDDTESVKLRREAIEKLHATYPTRAEFKRLQKAQEGS